MKPPTPASASSTATTTTTMTNTTTINNSHATTTSSNSPQTTTSQQENIKVAIRLRPFTEKERQKNNRRIVDIEENTVVLYSPKTGDNSMKKFTFDHSYWSHDGFKRDSRGVNYPDPDHPNCNKYVSQEKVFEDLGVFLLQNALQGYNSALLAYGQTGSGKSYTVSGYGLNEGILPRFARCIFAELEKKNGSSALSPGSNENNPAKTKEAAQTQKDKAEASSVAEAPIDGGAAAAGDENGNSKKSNGSKNRYEVYFSMIEIYNEVVRDLLATNSGYVTPQSTSLARRGLKVREHPKRGFFVENLTTYLCANNSDIERRIEEGQLNKSIAATSMNETSSRGHTIYEFRIKQYKPKSQENRQEILTTSIVQLVDLAGSERMAMHITAGNLSTDTGGGSRSNSPFGRVDENKVMSPSSARPEKSSSNNNAFTTPKDNNSNKTTIATRKQPTQRSKPPASASSTASSHQTVTARSVRRQAQNNLSAFNNMGHQQRFKESVSINQSLSVLGNCIQVLSHYSQQLDNNQSRATKQPPKIPYRDSVLTKLLNRCCLSGNSKVVIIATLSPADVNYDDTLSTLRFADRAKQIKTHATINRLSREQVVDALQKENERLKRAIDRRATRSMDDSSQASNFDDSEDINENFNGKRANKIDAVATPTRSRTVRKSRSKDKYSKAGAANEAGKSSSNPKLAVDQQQQMQRLVSPASKKLNIDNLGANSKPIRKSRSVGHDLAKRHDSKDEFDQSNEAKFLDDLDLNELADIEEGLMSPDSDDSLAALNDEGLSNDEKIGLLNKLLSNTSIANKIQRETASKTTRIPRPKRMPRADDGMNKMSVISSNLKKTNPYLSNLNPDEQLTGIISYIIKQGDTIVGKDNDCDIVIFGPKIRGKQAKLTRTTRIDADGNNNNADGSKGNVEVNEVYIEPYNVADAKQQQQKNANRGGQLSASNAAIMVNGTPVVEKTKLNHCDRLLFGSNSYFVFIDNTTPQKFRTGVADLDLVTYEMARSEVLKKVMSEANNEAMIREINDYTYRPGTGKRHPSKANTNATTTTPAAAATTTTPTTTTDASAALITTASGQTDTNRVLKKQQSPRVSAKHRSSLARTTTIQDGGSDDIVGKMPASQVEEVAEKEQSEDLKDKGSSSDDKGDTDTKSDIQDQEEKYRTKLMEDTYEYAMPVAEVNAVAKEMGIKIEYGLKILTGQEQLLDQLNYNEVAADSFSSSSMGDSNDSDAKKTPSSDGRVTRLDKLDTLDIPPALFIKVHLDELGIDFYWSKEKFQARRFKILELYGAWDVGGKFGLVENLVDQSKVQADYVIDPFIDDPTSTPVLIGHAQVTLQPISHMADVKDSYDIIDIDDEIVGNITIEAIPCDPERLNSAGERPYRTYTSNEIAEHLVENPEQLLNKKLVFLLSIISCQNIPDKYSYVSCQYTLNAESPDIRTKVVRENDNTSSTSATDPLIFNHSHYVYIDKVDQDVLDFLEHGFLTIQIVGQHKLDAKIANKPPTVVTTIINSINKYRYKLEQQGSYSGNYSGSAYDTSNTDSTRSNRITSSGRGINSNSGASSVTSASATVNLFDQQNDYDEGNSSINGLSQENIIDMILTKRKLDRAEDQLHHLKRTINIAEHYNKRHIPVKTVKKLLSSYGQELDSGSLEEITTDGPRPCCRTKMTAKKSTAGNQQRQQQTILYKSIRVKRQSSGSSNNSTTSIENSTPKSNESSPSTTKRTGTCRKSTVTRPDPLTSSYKIRRIPMAVVQKQSIRDPVVKTVARLHKKVDNFYSTGSQRFGQGIGKGGLKLVELAAQVDKQRRQQERQQYRRKQKEPRQRRSDDLDRIYDYDRPRKSIPRAPFFRLIRDIIRDVNGSSYKIQMAALDALHETAEGYLVSLFDTCSLLINHAGRVTLFPKDIDLARRVTKQGNYEAPLH